MPNLFSSNPASAFVISTAATGCAPPSVVSGTSVTVTSFTAASSPSTDPRNSMTLTVNASGVAATSYRLCVQWSSTLSYVDSGVGLTVGMGFVVFFFSLRLGLLMILFTC